MKGEETEGAERRPQGDGPRRIRQLLRRIAGRACIRPSLSRLLPGYGAANCALQWTDLDWDKATLEIRKSLEETKQRACVKGTKSGETRRFSIPAEVLEALKEHKRQQDEDRQLYGDDYANRGLMSRRPNGDYYAPQLRQPRDRCMRAAGLTGVSLHSLRHTHASELLSQGAPITAVAARLGHASPNITLGIYSHALPLDNQAAARLWNDTMAKADSGQPKENGRSRTLSKGIKEQSQENVIPIRSAS